ncbi:hypothetical protein NLJ89_g3803 [Agrocybe chaxingu]|uniref:F-box domain-containing protein n=1 Tax=Agrocybe chaxingu TaxID=84603 RepID=A0A9W8MY48_9AGAR|nr:hypothetical protein NLJ89_g3803 [Agrocybe chaxingu]
MAPRTRSKRAAEKLAVQQLLASGQNAKGLLALPDELCLEIASHFPSVPVPTPLIRKDEESERYHHRYPALLSLSQTCRALRRVFLRYLWQRIEVHEQMKADERTLRNSGELYYCRTDKPHMKELVRQLEVVTIRDPSLAVHVNILNVAVPDHSFESVMEKLARCITLFPNLHTVQLRITACFQHQFFMSNVFKQYTYPQIRTVAVCKHASPIMESCPRMVRLYAYDSLWCDDLDHVVEKRYPQLEVLGTPVNKRSLTRHLVESKYRSFVKGESVFTPLPSFSTKLTQPSGHNLGSPCSGSEFRLDQTPHATP